MHRFFVAPELLKNARNDINNGGGGAHEAPIVQLPEKLAHQVRDVLHLVTGEQLMLLDNSGDEFVCAVVKSARSSIEVEVIERRTGKSESPVRIILCQGLLKSARFEWILEKGTELGVSVFAPALCRRSTAGLEDAGPAKLQRWQRIIQEAAEQCGRARLPELQPICPLQHTLNNIPPGAIALMPWEEEHTVSLRAALRSVAQKVVVLFIGPEGGLTSEEVALAQRYGVQVVTLGARILRAETAALTSIANTMYELE